MAFVVAAQRYAVPSPFLSQFNCDMHKINCDMHKINCDRNCDKINCDRNHGQERFAERLIMIIDI